MNVDKTTVNIKKRRCKGTRYSDDIIKKLWVFVKAGSARRGRMDLAGSLGCLACSLEGSVWGNVWRCMCSGRAQGKGEVIKCPHHPLDSRQRH